MRAAQVELTGDTLSTSFMFMVPADAPASFTTPLLALRWVLRFQFVARQAAAAAAGAKPGAEQRLAWALPLHVSPPPE